MNRTHAIWARVVAAATAVAGCSDPERSNDDAADAGSETVDVGEEEVALIDHTAWRQVSPKDDPFGDAVDVSDCEPARGWAVELIDVEQSLGVDTNFCNQFLGEHPSIAGIEAGDRIVVRLWHFQLIGDSTAHIGIAFGDDVVWEHHIEMPTETGALVVADATANESHPAGTPIRFHLHNHGANTYNLIEIATSN